jgi:hypothetical protein
MSPGMVHGLLTDGTKDSTNQKYPSYTSSDYSSLELYFTENSNQSLDYVHKAKEHCRLVDACRLMISLQMSEPLATSDLEHLQLCSVCKLWIVKLNV